MFRLRGADVSGACSRVSTLLAPHSYVTPTSTKAVISSSVASLFAAEPAPVQSIEPEPQGAEDVCPVPPATGPAALPFTDGKQAYKLKTTGEILRSLLVFGICRTPWLVANADTLLARSKTMFGSTLVNFVVGNTFYKQFVAGEDARGVQPTLQRLRNAGIQAVLDYGAEDDVTADTGPASRKFPMNTVVAKTYKYEDEALCDRRLDCFLQSVDAARSMNGQGFAAIKVTALGMPLLLERVSVALTAVSDLFRQLDENGDGTLEPEEFRRVYKRLFVDSDESNIDRVFDYLDMDHDGKVDYVAFTKQVTVHDGATIAARCREEGPFSRAALTREELGLLENMMRRVNTLAEAAATAGVRLMIDAEHTYFQPAIDASAAELQRRHNVNEPLVWNTYQAYRRDVHERLALDVERSRREGYKFGAKLVRGAYMVLERRRAADLGLQSPVWDTKEQTDQAYDAAAQALLPLVRSEGAEIMVASHNQRSIEAVVAEMARLGLPPSSPVFFGQLLGMADHLTYTLGAHGYGAYKYATYGRIDEVMPYLIRRAQENSDMLGGVAAETSMLRKELQRRLTHWGGESLARHEMRLSQQGNSTRRTRSGARTLGAPNARRGGSSSRVSWFRKLVPNLRHALMTLLSSVGRGSAISSLRSADIAVGAALFLRGFSNRLGDSMSDAFYDVASSKGLSPAGSTDRPTSSDQDVRVARARQSSMSEPGSLLHDSLSEGNYDPPRRLRSSPKALSSVADPDTFWNGSSLSDGFYEMPASLRAAPRSRRSQSHRSAGPRSLPLMQRVVVQGSSARSAEGEPLHDSYSHTGY